MGHGVDEFLFGAVIAIEVGKEDFLLLDGQHRAEGAKEQGIDVIPALVIPKGKLTPEEQALLFVRFQTERRNMMGFDKYRALLRSGDPVTVAYTRVVDDTPYQISDMPTADNALSAVGALEEVYRRTGEAGLRDTLTLLYSVWPDNAKAVQGIFLRGVGLFLRRWVHETPLTTETKIINQMKKSTPEQMRTIAAQKALDQGGSLEENLVRVIEDMTLTKTQRRQIRADS